MYTKETFLGMSIRYWVEICKPLSPTCLPDCLEEKGVGIEGIFNQSIISGGCARPEILREVYENDNIIGER